MMIESSSVIRRINMKSILLMLTIVIVEIIMTVANHDESMAMNVNLSSYHDIKRNLWATMTTSHVPMKCTWGDSPMCCALLDESDEYYPRKEKVPTFHHLGSNGGGGNNSGNGHGHHNTFSSDGDTSSTHSDHGSSSTSSTSNSASSGDKQGPSSDFNDERRRSLASSSSGASSDNNAGGCKTTREYIPSAYEQAHIQRATEISLEPEFGVRQRLIIEYIEKDVENTNHWLARVDFHMRDTRSTHEKFTTPPHPDDLEYMSRFNITVTCGTSSHHWIEWIEPLTVHARHPNGLIEHCPLFLPTEIRTSPKMKFHSSHLTSPDYVLIQDNDNYHHTKLLGKHVSPIRKNYFFDAGANYFNTGTAWFTCAYLQKGIDFDHIYAVEYEKLDPIEYFRITPPKIVPFIHFMNIPASLERNVSGSILRTIKQVAREQDFVSFKLDIDTPEIEIPIFLDILQRDEYSKYIDEFFFELHFRCEFLMQCGWGDKMPEEVNGFKMERSNVMKAFQKLRYKGIRSHFWP